MEDRIPQDRAFKARVQSHADNIRRENAVLEVSRRRRGRIRAVAFCLMALCLCGLTIECVHGDGGPPPATEIVLVPIGGGRFVPIARRQIGTMPVITGPRVALSSRG